jgi:hypothetical protein
MQGRFWLLLGLSLMAAACGVAWPWRQRHAIPDAPAIEVPETLDLGLRTVGESVSCPIEVRNTGAEPLLLSKFRTSCGCLTVTTRIEGRSVPATEMTVPPGEMVSLWSGLVVPSGHAGGRLRQTVRFETNDPKRPAVAVEMTAEVQGVVMAVPTRLELGVL